MAAAQGVAAMLANASADRRASTVIICADGVLLSALDDRFFQAGLPRLGASLTGTTAALDGLLPLVLAMCWEPVDPNLLLEFCLMPGGPLGMSIGQKLADSLGNFPGLGSRSWEEVRAELTSPEQDPEQHIASRLDTWFSYERVSIGQPAPIDLLVKRCRTVAAWAGGRAALAQKQDQEDAQFLAVAGSSLLLAQLLETTGGVVTAPDTARLLSDVLSGTASSRHTAEAGAPLLVDAPWRIPPGTRHVIWIDPCAAAAKAPPWTVSELTNLVAQGLPVDGGEALAAIRRHSDLDGLVRITEDLLVITLPPAPDRTQHPAVLTLSSGRRNSHQRPTHRLNNPSQGSFQCAGWNLANAQSDVVAPQPQRPFWTQPANGLTERETHSYSELNLQLACPLSWTLTYAAKLRGGRTASLPDEATLQGSFAHSIMESVFAAGIPLPEEAANSAGKVFDERIILDAPPGYAESAGPTSQVTRPDGGDCQVDRRDRPRGGLHADCDEIADQGQNRRFGPDGEH
jgi:ATP-dependent helicase/nuclease subunit B